MSAVELERLGMVEKFNMKIEGGHTVHYDAAEDFDHLLHESDFAGAKSGYVLIRLDVDDEDYTVVHVDPPGGWWPQEGRAPADMVYRAAEYLRLLSAKLQRLEEEIESPPA